MPYRLFLDGTILPVMPEKVTVKINGNNEKVTLINEGEANILKSPGLTDVEFEAVLPNVKYPFAVYPDGFRPAKFYLDKLDRLQTEKKPFQYVVTRTDPAGNMVFDSNILVSLEKYTITEDASDGPDVTVKIELKQYREFKTKTCTIDISLPKPKAVIQSSRPTSANAPSAGGSSSYAVVRGDSLWKIAKQYYGDGGKWKTIYDKNKSVIGRNPNLIYPGQVFTIPAG